MGTLRFSLLLMALAFAPDQVRGANSLEEWGIIAFLAIVPTLGGYAFFTLALRYIPGTIAGLISVTELLWASILAYLLLGETLQPLQWAGCGLVLLASLLANVQSSQKAHQK